MYSLSGWERCLACPSGKYSNESIDCQSFISESITDGDSKSSSDSCLCYAGYYRSPPGSADSGNQDIGGSLGIRAMFGDNLELRAYSRYSNVGNVYLNNPVGALDADTLFGVGFGFTLIRGLSITGDYESGEFSSWNLGFRIDLDED